MGKITRTNLFGSLKLSKKFLLMYIFGIILPLIITDAFLLKSIYDAELRNQYFYRENAIDSYSNYFENLLKNDAAMASAFDLNKTLNSFINKLYESPYDYYYHYSTTIDNSFFTTLADYNRDRIVIYSDNRTMLNGNYFHPLSEAEKEVWFRKYSESGVNEAFYAYYDFEPVMKSFDQKRFIYVRRMTNTRTAVDKIVTIEHKNWRIVEDLSEIRVDCAMVVCCDDYIIYSNKYPNIDYQTLLDKASKEPYKTVKEYPMYGNSLTFYAFTEDLTVSNVISNNIPIIVLIIIVTFIIPILLMKVLERSITERITILGKAFGEGDNEIFQPIKEIKGTDEISALMHNYNRIVGINNELTNTIYKDKLREQESDLARKNAELLALQSQINPHFLFNALESIRMHSILKGENETAEMVQRLAVMQRQNVEWHDDAVTIEEEEGFIDAYLQLQSYRFGERISFNIDIDEECKKVLIPKLTLVTFVENACVHGIESKSAQGWIFVRVNKKEDKLIIEVEDTGDGMDEKEAEALQERMNNVTIDAIRKAKHVGILNACLRIKMMFRDQAKFAIDSEKGIGMSVIITIPAELITMSE
ncbi:MAG: histidine kinase [Clostridiales bacterium]|nr:histidine kinase [Clostridiales bacterium]